MKTAVSIPDEIYSTAEELCRRLSIPRSRLYALALEEYLERHIDADITAILNKLYADTESQIDSALIEAQKRAIGSDDSAW